MEDAPCRRNTAYSGEGGNLAGEHGFVEERLTFGRLCVAIKENGAGWGRGMGTIGKVSLQL